ncbi:hypothetical protein [Chitinophaga sp.]|uniref:hypothetical protein n=1 Tax=Chitinophaga sp. TaxID=1869181 RepID=UPI0031E48059
MQLLDDDMDELFRNAASQYPLKTDGADWDALSSRLQSAQPQGTAVEGVRSNKWVWLGISILLTVLFFISYAPPLKNGKLPRTGTGIATTKTGIATGIATTKTNANTGTGTITSSGPDTLTNKQTTTISVATFASPVPGLTINRFNVDKTTITDNKHISDSVIGDVTTHSDNTFAAVPTTLPADSTTAPAIATPVQGIPLQKEKEPVVKKQEPAKVQKGLYFGVIASPDISTVKMQRVNKVGYGAGIIVGYRISRSFAVETGLLYDRKNYYSEGSSFSTKKIPYIQNWKIINVDGYCNMYEIPVNVRYFIKNGQHTSWYANAGVSSYLMKKEDYNYNYYNDYGDLKNSSWAYKNATQNWFSIIHVGVGLEHNLGAIGKLRVEPYLKIPAKGLGIGDLPITSMGINIGITKSIR